MVTRVWLNGEPVVVLEKYLKEGSIEWNAHFSDASFGELANDCILNDLGDILQIKVRYAWRDVYGDRYRVYRVWMERRTTAGTWELLPNGYHEPGSSDLGNPAAHSTGHKDLLYEIVADDYYMTWRLRIEMLTGGDLPTGSTPSPNSEDW